MTVQLIIEFLAAWLGLFGNALLAQKGRHAGWGFAAFLLSNLGWLVFSWNNRHWGMFAQQLGFTVFSLYGVWNWIVGPWIDRRVDAMVQDALRGDPVTAKGGPEA